MRFLIVDTIYDGFLNWLYNERVPGLAARSFAEQYKAQVDGFFHSASAWTAPLQAQGHEVLDVAANNAAMQIRWMAENGLMDALRAGADALTFGALTVRQPRPQPWQVSFVVEQVKRFRPDVLLCANLYMFDDNFLAQVQGFYGKAVGQHAAVMPRNSLSRYDLIISSLPGQVMEFRARGVRSERVALAFDERMLPHLQDNGRLHEVAFIGQISTAHQGRANLIAEVAREVPLSFWGQAVWPADIDPSTLKLINHPSVWGLTMYQTLKDCRMVLNNHLDAAGPYANNLRLFEVTGVGSLLVTDDKVNLPDYFEPDREVVTYRSARECADKILDLLRRPDDVERIARAGQVATLARHSYRHRLGDLMALIA